MADAIRLEAVEKVYPGAVSQQVLFGVDLAIAKGSFCSLVGQSGSGKSTLLNIMGTLDRPTRGTVHIDGRRADTLSQSGLARLRNRSLGFVFQFHHLLPEFTALENVQMPALIDGKGDTDGTRDRARSLLDLVGVGDVAGKPAASMSGGQAQRVAIARALMNQPAVVLADEPTGNLDTRNSEGVYALFRKLNAELGTTFVIVTHDRTIAEQADRIIEIRDGRITMDLTK